MFVWPFLFKGMGGRVRLHGLPWTIFVPTQTLSHQKLPMGVKENSPAGITIPTIPSEPELLPFYELNLISEPTVTLGQSELWTPVHAKQKGEREHHPELQGLSNSRLRFVSEFLHVDFYQSRVVIRLLVAFRFGIFEFVVCFGVFKCVG